MKKIVILLLLPLSFCLSPCFAQQKTLDIAGIHQLVDESTSENKLQVKAKNQQALATANEQANLTLLDKLKGTYRTLQHRYNTLGTAINIADIGIYATPMVEKIVSNQAQIIALAEKNPALIVIGIAYLIMYLTGLMQEYALTSEISKYQELVGPNGQSANLEKMAWFAGNGVLSFGTVIIVFLIGAICMFTVPSISTWIISTSGISSAASTFGRNAGTAMLVARRASGSFI